MPIIIYKKGYCLFTITQATRFQLLEEIVTLIIYQDECREVFHFNLPDSLHTQFRIFHTFNALDIVLCKDSSRSADRTQIETTMFLTSISYLLAPITFCQHNHAASMLLEQIHIRVHTSCSSGTHRTTMKGG